MFRGIMMRTGETRIGRITISMGSCGRYYASFQFGSMEPFHEKLPVSDSLMGYDLGIRQLYTDSDGNRESQPDFLKKSLIRLAKEQKKLSRRCRVAKDEGRSIYESRNYQEQRLKVAAIHSHVAEQRHDFLNVVSKRELEKHGCVFFENVSSKKFLVEYAHSGHEYSHAFARALADKSWGIFLSMMEYKSAFYGRAFIKVDARRSSTTCRVCGHVIDSLPVTEQPWTCPVCGTVHDRDHNAANIVLQRGLKSLS